MPFCGCDKCGTVLNTYELSRSTASASDCWGCPECGRPMRRVTIREALELVRERSEAEQWRTQAPGGVRGGVGPAFAARTAQGR